MPKASGRRPQDLQRITNAFHLADDRLSISESREVRVTLNSDDPHRLNKVWPIQERSHDGYSGYTSAAASASYGH